MADNLFVQFAISGAMLVICVLVHAIGLAALSRALRGERALERMRHIKSLSPHGIGFTLAVVLALFVLHGLEIWFFALLYWVLAAVQGFEAALYFSTISYSTVGYSDTHIGREWRLIGAFESILGMILIGWSTAFFFRLIGRIDGH